MRTGKVHFLGYAVTMQEMNPGGAHTNRGQLNQVAVTSSGSGKSGSQPKCAVPQRPCLAGRALPPSRAAFVHGGIAPYWAATWWWMHLRMPRQPCTCCPLGITASCRLTSLGCGRQLPRQIRIEPAGGTIGQ